VVLANPFQEIAFGFSSWFPEEAIVFRPALSEPWFHSIRPVGHAVRGNGIQHLLVEPAAAFGIIARLQRHHRLERFERLDRSLETDRSGFEAVLAGGLSDDRADQVVSQNMGGVLLALRGWIT
jgi:hypothetical protein